WEPNEPATPSIQRITPDRTASTVVSTVAGQALRAPNDLAFGSDGRLWFTDPGTRFDDPEPGWVVGLAPDGSTIVVDVGPTFPNGVVALDDGAIAWVESVSRRVMRRDTENTTTHLVTLPPGHVPDGFAVAADGTYVIASIGSGGLDVVAADGTYLDFVEIGGCPLNCAFTNGACAGGRLVVACDPDREPRDAGRLVAVTVPLVAGPLFRGAV
ncbi:MAG: SMP-30/gluconolactonase/LRE family protein, partial [Micrococcales bacterium]|nr:SMP-30/gluconolactonase/LRE family protein [Micrococcales bacterium]